MNFEEFKEKTKEEMERRLEGGKVEIMEALKNNSVKRAGIAMAKPGMAASPVLYLESYYEKLQDGVGFTEIMEQIWKAYQKHMGKEPLDVEEFTDWGRAREKVSARLIHYGENRELLKAVPHKRFLDLAAVYDFMEPLDGGGAAAVRINNKHMERWGICREELEAAAYSNYKRSGGTKIRSMDSFIGELLGTAAGEHGSCLPMYVATNRWGIGGAAAMLFPEELGNLAERLGSDLYILPSSIHEVLLLPTAMGQPGELAEIVREVNRTQVLPEERLSDNVYRFCRERGEVRVA